jgi:transposase
MDMKHYVGLDVSLKETAICVVDETGTICREGKALSDPEAIANWLTALQTPADRVGLEAGNLARWLYLGLQERGFAVVCIDPRRLRGLTKTMPVKTDRNDARAIAQSMRVGWFTTVHIKSDASQEQRALLNHRKSLLRKQIDIENEIRGTIRVFGLKLVGHVTHASFEKRVIDLLDDAPRLLAMVRPMLTVRRVVQEQFVLLHKMVLQSVRSDDVCRRLMTIPGVGALTASTYLSTIDDPTRFNRSRDVGAHLGLTPRKYASGEVDRNGAISKCGDAALRTTLYQAALSLLTRTQRWSTLKAWGMAIVKRRGLRRAVVAVARKLSILMHRIWIDGATFRWSNREVTA